MKHLKPGTTYSVLKKNKLKFRGVYRRRYFNINLNQWMCVFQSLDGFSYYTPAATTVQALEL